jgi:hypothetical protein
LESKPQDKPLDISPLLGTWENTDPGSDGILRVVISEAPGGPVVRIFAAGAAGSPDLVDWGEVPIETLFCDGPSSTRAMSFTARFDLGYLTSHLQGNQNLGLLVLASFNRFQEGGRGSDYFSREFYHR